MHIALSCLSVYLFGHHSSSVCFSGNSFFSQCFCFAELVFVFVNRKIKLKSMKFAKLMFQSARIEAQIVIKVGPICKVVIL